MAKIFLDTNILVDIFEREINKIYLLSDHSPHTSPLSFHILSYITKTKIPSDKLKQMSKALEIVDLNSKILFKSLEGPTSDLEDNIQLHSASTAECDYFLTSDKALLKMKYFGQVEIVDSL
jgi:predicted nucleic acid-binding protein